MKKLMIVAAAALCAAVGFAEGIESSNVVGYDQTGLRFGTKGVGASFVNIGQTGAIDIQTLVVEGYDKEEGSEEEVSAMTLDEYGRTVDTYFWLDVTDGDDKYYGWFTGDGELAENVTVLPGEALCFNAPNSDYQVKSAGEVPTANIAVQLRFGTKLVVNPTPVVIDINDENCGMIVSGYEAEDGSEEEVSAMTLDEYGRTVDTYFWLDVIDGEDVYYGWFTGDGDLAEGVKMNPGESLCVNAPSSDFYVNFKGVEIK